MTVDVDARGERASRATARLLWETANPWPDRSAIVELVDGGADVAAAGRLAHDHQTGPLLWSALGAAERRGSLDGMHDLLRNDFHLHRGRGALLLPSALAMAVEPLRDAGLEPLIVKGPVIAMRYPEPGLRPMDDIDLVLPRDQFEVAVNAMLRSGWRVVRAPDREHPYDAVLDHPAIPHLPVEVHRGLASWRDHANRLTARDLWEARVPVDCLGTAVYGLPVEDELVFVCAHAAKLNHHFARLIWAVDLLVLVRAAGSGLDWDRVVWRSRRAGCATVVAVGMRHARRLGATVPDEVVSLPDGSFRRAALAPVLDESWPLLSLESEGVHHRMSYALTDLVQRRALLLLGETFADGVAGVPRRGTQALARAVRRWRSWRRTGSLGDPTGPDTRSHRAPAP